MFQKVKKIMHPSELKGKWSYTVKPLKLVLINHYVFIRSHFRVHSF